MSDLIERQAAIDALKEERCPCESDYDEGYLSMLDKAIWIMDEWLPSAQPEQRWIPCSERLPEKDGRYQVTRYDYVANTEFIDILWYEENLWWNRHSTGDYAVIAWMPLPEPYRAERRTDGSD